MRMVGTRVNFQAFEHIPAQLILGQHSPDRQLDDLLRLGSSHLFEGFLLQATYVSGVPAVFLVGLFLTCHLYRFSIGDHDKSPRINTRGKGRTILPHQGNCSVNRKLAKDHVLGIDVNPSTDNIFFA